MLDIKFIRENADLVKVGAKKKHIEVDIDKLLKLDEERISLQQEIDEVRQKQNEANGKIASASGSEKEDLLSEMRGLKDGLQGKEKRMQELMEEWRNLMLRVPNIPDFSVPEGVDDSDNREERTWGEKPSFSFKPKDHIELMTNLDMVDFERGSKVSGFRGYFLKGDGARLSMALWQFAMDELYADGFTPMTVPSLVRKEPFFGTGYLPQGEEDLYKTQDDEYLAGTGEVSMMAYHMNENVDLKKLPIKFAAFSPCFRREAGSHGKDTKGLIRVHEFFKVEQVILCKADHAESVKWHEYLTEKAESFMQKLGLHYHVVTNCGGDLGLGQVKKYDIEAWVPSQENYRETHSASYFHDFQTRRLNIRYKDEDGKLRYAHSLNNTAIATPRILVPLIENNQQEDGSIKVPEPLRKYLGKDLISKNE